MRLIFFGSGAFGLPTFEHLAARHEVAMVVTQPDRPAGRKRRMTSTPVAAWAEARGLPVLRCEDANDPAVVARLAALSPRASVVIAFGQKLGEPLIAAAGELVVNLHASLLPKFRGAAPINHAILAGERETGVSVISLASRMDAGLIYARVATPIEATESAGELHDRLALLGPDAVEQVLTDFEAGRLHGQKQDETRVTRAPKLSRVDDHVDFSQSAEQVCRRILGLNPWPGVTVHWLDASGRREPVTLKLLRAQPGAAGAQAGSPAGVVSAGVVVESGDRLLLAAGQGLVEILELQPQGRRAMSAAAFCQGHGVRAGDRFEPAHESHRP
jgi:methionyl-tRNA formyltransferase